MYWAPLPGSTDRQGSPHPARGQNYERCRASQSFRRFARGTPSASCLQFKPEPGSRSTGSWCNGRRARDWNRRSEPRPRMESPIPYPIPMSSGVLTRWLRRLARLTRSFFPSGQPPGQASSAPKTNGRPAEVHRPAHWSELRHYGEEIITRPSGGCCGGRRSAAEKVLSLFEEPPTSSKRSAGKQSSGTSCFTGGVSGLMLDAEVVRGNPNAVTSPRRIPDTGQL